MRKRLITSILIFVFVSLSTFADVSFTVAAPQRVKQGDKFAVTFRLKNAQGSNLKAPQISGCAYIYGPSVSTSQSYQIVGGQMSSSMSTDYTYYYKAEKIGDCVVGEATVQANGKTYRTSPHTITVVASSQSAQNGSAQANNARSQGSVDMYDIDTQTTDKKVSSNDVFVRVIMSKSSVYEQEAVECVIKLYTKYSITSFRPTKMPEFDNFLIEELDAPAQLNQEETFNGNTYMTAVLKKCILYPQKTGTLKINTGNYDVTVAQYEKINMGLFTVNQPRERQIQITSNSGSLNVLPLPEPRPVGFQGAVGRFSAESHLVGNNFKSGDPASLIITIKGTGNIKYLKEPEIEFPTQFEVYTPSSNVNAAISGNNVTGEMTVDYTFVPETAGQFSLQPQDYVYFDPSTKKYETIKFPKFDMKVAKGVNRSSQNDQQSDIDVRIQDIRYIDLTAPESLSTNHTFMILKWWYWLIPFLMCVAMVGTLVAYREKLKRMSDISNMKVAKANKIAQKRLREAKSYMTNGDSDKFYDEMIRALWGYLSDKLSIPVSQLSRDNISGVLSDKGFDENVVNMAISLINECETARYTPSNSHEQLDSTYRQACELINVIERQK